MTKLFVFKFLNKKNHSFVYKFMMNFYLTQYNRYPELTLFSILKRFKLQQIISEILLTELFYFINICFRLSRYNSLSFFYLLPIWIHIHIDMKLKDNQCCIMFLGFIYLSKYMMYYENLP